MIFERKYLKNFANFNNSDAISCYFAYDNVYRRIVIIQFT